MPALALLLLVLSSACLMEPHAAQSAELLEQLGTARAMLAEQPRRVAAACTLVGAVQTRLYGEPGLTDVRPAWAQLRDAADALQAVCGQGTLLEQSAADTAAMQAARLRWAQGVQRDVGVACAHLRAAAGALGRGAPC